MRHNHWARIAGCATLALTVLVAVGCGGKGSDTTTSGLDLSSEDAFLRDMIPHHEGAVEWAKLVLERGEHPELREMAASTLKGSTDDLEAMHRLLGPGKSTHAHSHGGEHFGPAGIAQIRAGAVNDKILLSWMIDHHQVGTDAGHGTVPKIENPEIKTLVDNMNGRLDKGLERMRSWRTEWYGA